MVSKTKPDKKSQKRADSQRLLQFGILIGIVIVIIALILWRNTSIYSLDPEVSKNQIDTLLAKVRPNDSTLLIKKIYDAGCSDKNSVGFAKRIKCSINAYQYLKTGEATLSSSLRNIHSTLITEGWSTSHVSSGYTLEQALSGKKNGLITYFSNDKNSNASLSIGIVDSNNRSPSTGLSWSILESTSADKKLEPGDIVIGIEMSQIYWSCSHESLVQIPCFGQPGKLD